MNSLALRDEHVSLPARYEAAKRALAECERVDECQDYANKAAALAVYARQSKDDSLVILAQRIQARAIRRCGELLALIPALNGVKTPAKTALTRTAAARSAGISESQQANAMKIARLPTEEFERRVDSGKPPSVSELAGRNWRKKQQASGRCPTCGRPL